MPVIALAVDSSSTPLKALEQVLRDRHAHVFVLRSDDPLADIEEATPDAVVLTSPEGAELARSIRARYGDGAPRLIGVFPESDASSEGSFDEHIAEALCARTLARLLSRSELRPSARGRGSDGAARS